MAWNRPTQKIESEGKDAKRPRVWWGFGAGLIAAVVAVAGVVSYSAGAGRPRPGLDRVTDTERDCCGII